MGVPCPDPVAPYGPPDPYSNDTANLTGTTQNAIACMKGIIAQAHYYGKFYVTFGYRSSA